MQDYGELVETPQVSIENSAARKLSLEATGSTSNQNQQRVKLSFGQVDSVSLRADWERGVTQESPAPFSEYHSSKFPETKLCFYYRGQRMSDAASENFAHTLARPNHSLSKTEIKSLQELLGAKADEHSFKILDARTQSLNGKHVLIVRGAYTEKHYETESVYVDSDGSGSAVQEIYWQSPRAQYVAQGQARAALRSISWK